MPSTPQKIGHGAVGCVYRPAIPCKDGTIPAGYVSKLVKKTSLPMEYNEEILAKLKEIDPEETYVIRPVKPEEICADKKNAQATNENISSCTPFQEQVFQGKEPVKKNNTAVLYQKDAGSITLANLIEAEYTRPYEPSETILNALKKAIDVEDFLLVHGLTHADISFGNIMVLHDRSVRFIDTAGLQRTNDVEGAKANFLEALRNSQISTNVGPLKRLIKPFQFGLPREIADGNENNENSQGTLASPDALELAGDGNNENSEGEGVILTLPAGGKRKRRKTRGLKGQKKRKRSTKKVRRSR